MPPPLSAEFTRSEVQRLETVAASAMLELPARLRQDWDRLSLLVARSGRSDELHAVRNEYRKVYEGHLQTLEGFLELAEAVGSPITEQFRHAVEQLQQLKQEIFAGWDTQEDLEKKLIAKLSLPNEVLLALAAKYPPPQSWYDETSNPFIPDSE